MDAPFMHSWVRRDTKKTMFMLFDQYSLKLPNTFASVDDMKNLALQGKNSEVDDIGCNSYRLILH